MWYLNEDEEQPSSDQAIEQLDSLRKEEDEELADNQFLNKEPEPKPSTITEATMDVRSEDAIRGYLSSLPPLEVNSFSNNNNGAVVDPTGRDSVGMDIDSPQLARHKSYDEGDFQFNFELEGGSERTGFTPPRSTNNDSNNNEGHASPTEAFVEFRDEYRADKFLISDFLENATVYDAMPLSGKMVVLDTNLTVKAGFQALVENGTYERKSCRLNHYTDSFWTCETNFDRHQICTSMGFRYL
jgi:hypothetical protein